MSQSRARPLTEDEIPRPMPEDVGDRVEFIADVMHDLRWERGKTGKLLAKVWGCSLSTIENYSAEASRLVIGDSEQAKRDITAGCKRLFRDAVEKGNAKAAKAMGDLWANVSGAMAPQKHQVGALDASPEAAATAVREAFGTHAAVKSERPDPAPVSDRDRDTDPVPGSAPGE